MGIFKPIDDMFLVCLCRIHFKWTKCKGIVGQVDWHDLSYWFCWFPFTFDLHIGLRFHLFKEKKWNSFSYFISSRTKRIEILGFNKIWKLFLKKKMSGRFLIFLKKKIQFQRSHFRLDSLEKLASWWPFCALPLFQKGKWLIFINFPKLDHAARSSQWLIVAARNVLILARYLAF